MKRVMKKILIVILIILVLNSFFITNLVHADVGDFVEGLLGSVVGLLTWPVRLIALAAGMAVDTVTKFVAYSAGTIVDGKINSQGAMPDGMITPFDIFFNKIALINVNFFDIPNDGSIVSNIRSAIAAWYYIMRNIASVILLCVLIYVGIRMAISTVASDKAAYKKMLFDWVCSLALIFLIQYIIIFTVNVNDVLVKALSNINQGTELSEAMNNIKMTSLGISINAIAATIVFCMLVAQTIGLLITYINRMLKLAFLIIISPLITLTYSMDKMGDGKAQALGTWLKEFIYTVLIQPFHCVIYMSFISMALSILGGDVENNLAGAIIAMLCVKFTKEGEKLLGKIFKFGEHTSDTSLAVGMAASAVALSKAKSVGKGTRKAVNGIKNVKGNIGEKAKEAKVNFLAAKAYLGNKKGENGEEMTFAQAKDDVNAKITAKQAKKAENKNAQKYGVSTKDKKYQKEVSEKANELMKTTGMTKNLAFATARAQVAAKKRTEAKDSNFKAKHPKIHGARTTMKKVATIARESETLKDLNNMRKGIVAAGLGTFAGSATYGASGNLANSIALGVASYRGANEFMQSSSKTLVNSADQIMQGMGVKSEAEAANMMEQTQAMAPILGDNQELQNYLNDLLECVDRAITDATQARTVKNSIKSTVAKEVKKDPTASLDDIMKKVEGNDNVKPHLVDLKNNGLESAVQSVANTQRHKELYDTMQNASDVGIDPGRFSKMVSKRFEGNGGEGAFKGRKEIVSDIVSGQDGKPNPVDTEDKAQELLRDKTEEEKSRIIESCNDKLDEVERDIRKAEEENEKIGERAEKLNEELSMVTEQLNQANEKLNQSNNPVDQLANTQEATRLIQLKANLESKGRSLDKKQVKLDGQLDTLQAQRDALSTSIGNLETARNNPVED